MAIQHEPCSFVKLCVPGAPRQRSHVRRVSMHEVAQAGLAAVGRHKAVRRSSEPAPQWPGPAIPNRGRHVRAETAALDHRSRVLRKCLILRHAGRAPRSGTADFIQDGLATRRGGPEWTQFNLLTSLTIFRSFRDWRAGKGLDELADLVCPKAKFRSFNHDGG